MADKFKRYGIPVRLENTPLFKKMFELFGEKISGCVVKAAISTSRKIPYFSTTEDGSYFTSTAGDGSTAPTASGLVPVATAGKISVNTPTGDYHAANKKYVDDAIAALKAELTQ